MDRTLVYEAGYRGSNPVGIRESAVFYSKILCFTILFVVVKVLVYN